MTKLFIAALAVAGLLVLIGLLRAQPRGDSLRPGQPAPDFSLPDASGELHSLRSYRGGWLVLYFYPKDDTPGCTREACEFRDGYREIRGLNAKVLGVSLDDAGSHGDFAEKYHLPFPLLSDKTGTVARQYGALWSLGPIRFAKRHSFLIDPQGKLAKIYRKVDPATHTGQIVQDLQALQGN
jgi:peroxiredoxin Q/BCP